MTELLALQSWNFRVLLSMFTYYIKYPLWILSSMLALLSSPLYCQSWKTRNISQIPYHQSSSFILLIRPQFGKPLLSSSGGWRKVTIVIDAPLKIGHVRTAGIWGHWWQLPWLLYSLISRPTFIPPTPPGVVSASNPLWQIPSCLKYLEWFMCL